MTVVKRKKLKSVIAAITVLVLFLTFAYAWVSDGQNVLNRFFTSTPSVVLHDDFNDDYTLADYTSEDGAEKSVYAENTGAVEVIVRIRLDEFMEIGIGAGQEDGTPGKDTEKVVEGSLLDNLDTWEPHIPNSAGDPTITDAGFNDYWDWTMGGWKYYRKAETLSPRPDGAVQDRIMDPNDGRYGYVSEYTDDSHEDIEKTIEGRVITMSQWTDPNSVEYDNLGDYWIIDNRDGWAYWGDSLAPGDATGLLLNKVKLKTQLDRATFYGINVTMQALTLDEEENGWFFVENDENSGPTDEARHLLDQIANKDEEHEEIDYDIVGLGDRDFVLLNDELDLQLVAKNDTLSKKVPDNVYWVFNDESNKTIKGTTLDYNTGKLKISLQEGVTDRYISGVITYLNVEARVPDKEKNYLIIAEKSIEVYRFVVAYEEPLDGEMYQLLYAPAVSYSNQSTYASNGNTLEIPRNTEAALWWNAAPGELYYCPSKIKEWVVMPSGLEASDVSNGISFEGHSQTHPTNVAVDKQVRSGTEIGKFVFVPSVIELQKLEENSIKWEAGFTWDLSSSLSDVPTPMMNFLYNHTNGAMTVNSYTRSLSSPDGLYFSTSMQNNNGYNIIARNTAFPFRFCMWVKIPHKNISD